MKKINATIISLSSIILYLGIGAIIMYFAGMSNKGLSTTINATARISLIVFALIFVASPLHTIRPSGFTRWLLKWRKEIGITFGITFLLSHLGLIFLILEVNRPVTPDNIRVIDIYAGGLGIFLLFLMLVTSFKKIRSSISPRTWKAIHFAGLYYVWGVFIVDMVESYFIKEIKNAEILYIPFIIILSLVMGIRLRSTLMNKKTADE